MPIVWNPPYARYRDTATGRFISRNTVLGYLAQSMEASGERVSTIARTYSAGSLSAKEFSTAFRQEIKGEFIRQYVTGRGGVPSMTQSDWGKLGSLLKEQYKYEKGFVKDLGDLTESQIATRANMYVNAAGAAYEHGQLAAIKASGRFTQEFWELGDKEHCSGCEELNAKGWVDIGELGTVPKAGSTPCLTQCGCAIKYR